MLAGGVPQGFESTTIRRPYGDWVTRQRLATMLTVFGHSTSLEIIGYTSQPPEVTRRLQVPAVAAHMHPAYCG
jgi:hypothetical protein